MLVLRKYIYIVRESDGVKWLTFEGNIWSVEWILQLKDWRRPLDAEGSIKEGHRLPFSQAREYTVEQAVSKIGSKD